MDRNRRWFSVTLSGLSIAWLGMIAAFLPLFGAYEGFTIYVDLKYPDANVGGLIVYAGLGFLGGLAGTGILGLLFEIHDDLSAIREFSVGRLPKDTAGTPLSSGRRADDPRRRAEGPQEIPPPENIDDGP